MEGFINILSLNVGLSSTLAGISTIATIDNVDIFLLQEVRVSSEQLNLMLEKLGFCGESNIDIDAPSKPGTAIAWRNTLPISEVHNIVTNRLQIALLDKVEK